MLSIVSVEWFRSRQEETRKKLVSEAHPLKYTEEDADLTAKRLFDLTGSEKESTNIMLASGVVFLQYGRPDVSSSIYRECLKFENLTPWHKGVIHENLATIYRDSKPPKAKLMVGEMKKAMEFYRQSGDHYRVCVALKNLGEAEWNLGFKELGMNYFDEAKGSSVKLEQSDRAGVLWNLACAAKRVGDAKLEKRFLAECMKECPEDRTHMILEINRRLNGLGN